MQRKFGNPLVIRCKFGAVTNPKPLVDAHRCASLNANKAQKSKELRGVLSCRCERRGVGCTTFNPLIDGSIPAGEVYSGYIGIVFLSP